MKATTLILTFLLANYGFCLELNESSYAEDERVIYGETDDRISPDLYEFSDNMLKVSNATAALISTKHIDFIDGKYALFGQTLKQEHGLCSNEQFANELSVVDCTGVLVAPNLLLTASHCIFDSVKKFCKHYKWVFNYKKSRSYQSKEQVYGCTAVLENVYNRKLGIDYALVALDEYIDDIEPVDINFSKELPDEDDLAMVGHPAGLPQKITVNASFRELKKYYALMNFDSFSGNSGSPIVNVQTGMLEGLLIAGEKDFVYDKKSKCKRAKRCGLGKCSGEQVTLARALTNLKKYIKD